MQKEFTDKWFKPLEEIAAQLALQQVRSNPVLERAAMSDSRLAPLVRELGG